MAIFEDTTTLTDTSRDISKVAAGSASKTSKKLDIYVDDINGKDVNPGTEELPLKSYLAAVDLIPDFVYHDVTIHLNPHSGDGYRLSSIQNKMVAQNRFIRVTGDDNFTELQTSTAAASGSGQQVVVGTGFTADEFLGKTIEILTGAAAGDRRTIRNNTTTDIVPVQQFSAAVAENDLYRLVEPVVTLALPSQHFGAPSYDMVPLVRNCPGPVDLVVAHDSISFSGPSVYFDNLRFASTETGPVFGGLGILSSSVAFYGVLLEPLASANNGLFVDEASLLWTGADRQVPGGALSTGPEDKGLTAGSWLGWGMTSLDSMFWLCQRLKGFVVADRLVRLDNCHWKIWGGRFHESRTTAGVGAALSVYNNSIFRIPPTSDAPETLFTSTQDAVDRSCIDVRSQASVYLSNVILEKTNQGCGIVVWTAESGIGGTGSGHVALMANVTITGITDSTAPDFGVVVAGGGVVNYDPDPTMTGWPVGQQLAVRTSIPGMGTTIQDEDLSFLTTGGDALPASATSDGRNGWIRRIE